VVTEAGFGFDLGGEKFFDLKCVSAGLDTAAVVLVVTMRALKYHGGVEVDDLASPDAAAAALGLPNLVKHVENVRAFGERPVVALNRYAEDTAPEIKVVSDACAEMGVPFAVCDGYARGGDGATELADMVVQHAERRTQPFTPLYDWSDPVHQKMEHVARTMYGAASVDWAPRAERDLDVVRRCGAEGLPLCVAKTSRSLSDEPGRRGRPDGFTLTVNAVHLAAGAGYLVPVVGNVLRMPGLPAAPQSERMDLESGVVRW
jgi:formate--tetrahydrofolate ligase